MTDLTCEMCPAPATKQQYRTDVDAQQFTADPWAAENYQPVCDTHASADAWPLPQTENGDTDD